MKGATVTDPVKARTVLTVCVHGPS